MNTKAVALLKSSNPDERLRAVRYLANQNTQDALDALVNAYQTERDPRLRGDDAKSRTSCESKYQSGCRD